MSNPAERPANGRRCSLGREGFLGHYLPAEAPSSAVMVISGSGGGLEFALRQAEELSRAGLTTLAVAYHGAPGLPQELRSIPLEYFARALRWFGSQPEVRSDQLFILGSSRGSEAALLTALHFPDAIAGVVALVPGNVILCSWPPGHPAWMLDGQPLPYTGFYGPLTTNPDAYIASEHIQAPILAIAGGQDQTWPSADMARALLARRGPSSHPADRLLVYPEAGHALGHLVMNWNGPDPEARADALSHVVAFTTNN